MSSISRILDKCTRSGADMAEVYNLSQKKLTITVREGKVEAVTKASPGGTAVRFFSSGRMAFAHTTDTGERAIDELVSRLANLAKKTAGDTKTELPGPVAGPPDLDIYNSNYVETSIDRKIEYLRNLEQLALK